MQQPPLLSPETEHPWARPEVRRGLFARAIAEKDLSALREGFEFFLREEGKAELTVMQYASLVEQVLRHLWLGLGRQGLDWGRADLLLAFEELKSRGRSPGRLWHFRFAFQAFARFVAWSGGVFPEVELPQKPLPLRKTAPLSDVEMREALKLVRAWPSAWSVPLEAVFLLIGETGLRLKQLLALDVEDYDPAGHRLRLPGGWAELPRSTKGRLDLYLTWRRDVRRGGFGQLILNTRGEPANRENLRDALRRFVDYSGLDLSFTRLRLRGSRRLVERYGGPKAKQLLKRHAI